MDLDIKTMLTLILGNALVVALVEGLIAARRERERQEWEAKQAVQLREWQTAQEVERRKWEAEMNEREYRREQLDLQQRSLKIRQVAVELSQAIEGITEEYMALPADRSWKEVAHHPPKDLQRQFRDALAQLERTMETDGIKMAEFVSFRHFLDGHEETYASVKDLLYIMHECTSDFRAKYEDRQLNRTSIDALAEGSPFLSPLAHPVTSTSHVPPPASAPPASPSGTSSS